MVKYRRNIYNPITPRDWFLYYLFHDNNFVTIRKQWRAAISDIDQTPGQEKREHAEMDKITRYYIELLCQKLNINEMTALMGLRYTRHNRVLNKDRVPTAAIQGDHIVINIGANTKLEDIEGLWNIWITRLQRQLPNYDTSREIPTDEPLLIYAIHKQLLKGRKMTEVHAAYLNGTLHGNLQAGDKWLDVNDFRKYYHKVVKGYVDRAPQPS